LKMDDHQDSRLAAIPGDENHLQHLSEHDGSTPFTGSGVLAEEDLFSISQHASRYVSPPITHNLSAIQNLHSQHQELPLVSAVFFDAIISNGLILETKKNVRTVCLLRHTMYHMAAMAATDPSLRIAALSFVTSPSTHTYTTEMLTCSSTPGRTTPQISHRRYPRKYPRKYIALG